MDKRNAGACYQGLLWLGLLLVQFAGLALPGRALAQQNNWGPPYKFTDLHNVPSAGYFTLDQAIAGAKAAMVAQAGPPTSACPLQVLRHLVNGYPYDVADVAYGTGCYSAGGEDIPLYALGYGYDVGKNAGSCDCDGHTGHIGGAAPGTPVKGKPINVATGNKFEQDTDYLAPNDWLTFRRFYNGLANVGSTTLGSSWRHSFDRSLQILSSTAINAFRPDGKFELFTKQSDGSWKTDADVTDILAEWRDASGNLTAYSVTVATSQQGEFYFTDGRLSAVYDFGLGQWALGTTYSTASTPTSVAPQPNLLLSVSDPSGRALNFTYDSSARLHTVTQPDGGVLTYGYDANGNLTSVQYPDGKTRQYVYNEASLTGGANLPGVLTGVIDETATRYASTTYDSQGRATSEYMAGGAGAITVAYGSTAGSTPRTITTALGVTSSLGIQNILGSLKVKSSSQPCGADCNQPWSVQTYDANGYPASVTDFNNNVTKTTYDANGLLDQEIDAFGTAIQRTTNTTWNTGNRVPLTRVVLNASGATVASSKWTYNSRGQATARCEIDPTVSAVASYACGSAANAPAGVRQWTMTYCDAVDNTQCPIIGIALTVTGPRTDLTQTLRYTYYLDDTSTHRHGDLKSATDALGHITTYVSYDGAGRVTRTIDPNGVIVDLTYTPRGWLATRTIRYAVDGSANAFDVTTTISYTAYGAVASVTDADGVKATYGYDAAHRLTSVTDTLGNTLQYTLDASGNRLTEKTYTNGSSTPSRTLTRTFNPLGQLTKVVDGLGQTVFDASASGNYDGNGNLVQSLDAAGIAHRQGYDALNRLVQTIDNYNGTDTATQNTTTTRTLDALDRLTAITDPSNLTTGYGYDGLSNPASLSSPDTSNSHGTFDAAGNALIYTDARGITITNTYDALDRLLSSSYPDSSLNVGYHYDEPNSTTGCASSYPLGRLTRIVENTVTTAYCYDNQGHLIQKTQAVGGHTDTTVYYYSAAGRFAGLQYPDNNKITYWHDSDGRISSVELMTPGQTWANGTNVVLQASYLPFGPLTSYQYNGQTVTRTYDANYALTDLVSPALNLHFARDAMGNIKAEGNAPGASPAVETYSYDPLQRLTSIQQGGTVIEGLTYNPTGDRLSKTGSGLATGAYGYQTNTHWLTSIGSAARTYDPNGNTTGASSAGQTWGYGYNARNRLSVVQANGSTVGTYTYNALGQRVQKVVTLPSAITQRFAYDEQSHLVGEYTSTNNRDTIWLGDMPVATVDTSGTASVINYVIGDHLGTPRAVVNSAGTTIWSWPYIGNAFGELAPASATGYMLNLRFPGQYFDAESGLVHNGYRDYCVECGRYIQSDPIGLNGGISSYAYVGSNSLNIIDLSGLQAQVQGAPRVVFHSVDASGIFTVAGQSIAADIAYLQGVITENDLLQQTALDAMRETVDPHSGAEAIIPLLFMGEGEGGELSVRVEDLHAELDPYAQTKRTTAGMDTAQGTRVMASGTRDLSPAQRANLKSNEIGATCPGAHAEVTLLNHARMNGLNPIRMATSWTICPSCRAAIEESGGVLTNSKTASWPKKSSD